MNGIALRQTNRQFRIQNGRKGDNFGIQDLPFAMGLCFTDDRGNGGLAAGAGCGGNRNQQHRLFFYLENPNQFSGRLMISNRCSRGFGGIQHRTAAHCQNGIAAGRTAYGLFHYAKGRIGADAIKYHGFDTVFFDFQKGLIQLAAAHHSGSGHHKHPAAARFPQQFRCLPQPAGANVG